MRPINACPVPRFSLEAMRLLGAAAKLECIDA